MSTLPSISPSEFAARVTAGGFSQPLSYVPSIIGSSDPKRPADQQAVGVTSDTIGGWVKRAMNAAWNASPLSVSEAVSVPIAQGFDRAGAGAQALLAGAGNAVSEVGEGARSVLEGVGNYTKYAFFLIILVGGLWMLSVVMQATAAARSAAK